MQIQKKKFSANVSTEVLKQKITYEMINLDFKRGPVGKTMHLKFNLGLLVVSKGKLKKIDCKWERELYFCCEVQNEE